MNNSEIDDEFRDYMRLVNPELNEAHPQYAIRKNTFFAGMMAMLGTGYREQLHIQKQLRAFVDRVDRGMEPGFSNTDFDS